MSFFKRISKDKIEQNKNNVEEFDGSIQVQDKKNIQRKKVLQETIGKRVHIGVGQVEDTMEQILDIIKKIADEAEKQSYFLGKSMEVVNESAAFSQQVAVSTSEAGEVTHNALGIAQKGKTAVDSTINHMNSIKESVEKIQTVVLELGNKSKKIETIISTIKEIANQTNLLALNATIEAARAGEHGKGFAVVAQEVRKLAEKSETSTEEISSIVKDIQRTTADSIRAMEESAGQVYKGVQIAKETERSIEEIVAAVDISNTVTTEINEASHRQAENIEFMIKTMDDMERAAQQVINLTETATMDAQYQRSSVNNLKVLAKKLDEVTKSTVESLSSFTNGVDKEVSTIRALNSGIPSELDPAMSYEQASINITANIHAGLVKFGEGNEIIPSVAKSWFLEDDGITWSFQLRKGVKFHNGRELKARDFKYSIERILDPKMKSPNTWLFEMIAGAKNFLAGKVGDLVGIKIINDYSLSITLEKPNNAFILNLAQMASSILCREAIDSLGREKGILIGAGAYKVKEYTKDGMLLEAYDDYLEGRAFIDQVELMFHEENRVEAFEKGKLDVMLLDKDNYNYIKNIPEYKDRIRVEDGYGIYYVGFNMTSKNPLVQSKISRQAMNHCINKDELIGLVTNGLATAAKGPLPPSILHDPNLTGYSYNLSKAKSLLEQAGFKGNQKGSLNMLFMDTVGDPTYELIAKSIQKDLKEIGIETKITSKPRSQYLIPEDYKTVDLFVYRWIGDTGDPDNFLQPMFNSNNTSDFTKYHNPEVESLMDAAISIKNPIRRQEQYYGIQQQIVDDAPWIFLFYNTNNYVFKPYVKGAKLHPLGFYKLNNIWLDC